MRYTINITRKALFLMMLLAVPFIANSQARPGAPASRVLTGVVTSASGPLMGAAVQVMDQNNRAVGGSYTSANGEYYIRISGGQNYKIVASFLGYKSASQDYTGQPTINFRLEEELRQINTVIVEAQGVRRNAMDIPVAITGGATQVLQMDNFRDVPATSVADVMYGQMMGVDITSMSGDPGAKSQIRIRGVGSLNASNEPLFVVNGIPYEPVGNTEEFAYQTADENDFGALLNINPTDIEMIEVQSDAMATAEWGSKGANGVILITTKSGATGRTTFLITERFTYNFEPRRIPLLDGSQYVMMVQESEWNKLRDFGYSWSNMDALSSLAAELSYDPSYRYFDEYNANTDWLDLVRKTSFTNDIGFNMSGGGDQATYIFSLTNTDEGGNTRGTSYNRLTTRFNVKYTFSKKFYVESTISYTQNKRDDTPDTGGAPNPRAIAEIKAPNMSPYEIDSDGNITSQYFIRPSTEAQLQGGYFGTSTSATADAGGSSMYNPVAMVNEAMNKLTGQTIEAVVAMRYDVIGDRTTMQSLTYQNNMSLRMSSGNRRSFLPAMATGVPSASKYYNRAMEAKNDNTNIYVNNQLSYSRYFNSDRSTALYLSSKFSFDQVQGTTFEEITSGMADEAISDPVQGTIIHTLGSSKNRDRSAESMSAITFNLLDRYSANIRGNMSGNTKLGPKARWKFYPAASVTWHFQKERFLSGLDWLRDGRLSVSWGRTPRYPGSSFSYIGTVAPSSSYLGSSAIAPNKIQADNLRTEINERWNVKLEGSINDKFTAEVNYYRNENSDLLQQNSAIPWSTGFSNISWYNSGKTLNEGIEFSLNFQNVLKHPDWRLTGGLTFTANRNKILELPINRIPVDYSDYPTNGRYAFAITLGNPIGSVYGFKYEGVYGSEDDLKAKDRNGNDILDILGNPVFTTIATSATANYRPHLGDAKYKDVNYDGVIDRHDIIYLGNSQPLFYSGQNLSLRYKNIQAKIQGYLYVGKDIVNRARMNTENMQINLPGTANNQSTAVLRRWRHEGDNTDIPRALSGSEHRNWLGSSRFIDDGSYFRIKFVTLTYYLGERLGSKLGLQPNATSIYVTGYDLFTITGYSGQDPEVSDGAGMFPVAEDNSRTPRPVRLTVGMQIKF